RARAEWQIPLTLEPHNAAAREGQARLEARLQRALASRLRQGQEALRRGAQLEARRNFLAALALDPGNKVAFETLRDRVKEIHFVAHTVARGETLASIADRYYGDRLRSEVIWEMNQLSSRPKAGSQLKIPEIPGVPFRTAALQRTAAARRLEPTRPEPTPQEPTRPEPTPQEPKRAEPAQPEPTQPEPPDAEPAQPEPPAPAAEAEESARGAGEGDPAALQRGHSPLPGGAARGRDRQVAGGARVRLPARRRQEEHRPGRTDPPGAAGAAAETVGKETAVAGPRGRTRSAR